MTPAHALRIPFWLLLGLATFLPDLSFAGNPARVAVPFSITRDVGVGNEVFVSGAHRDLTSGGIQPFGIKLHYSTGNVWFGAIAHEVGAQVTYTFYSRPISNTAYCGGNSSAISQALSLTVPSAPEFAMPVLTAIPLQLLAYHLAVELGRDVDKPRNLAKSVTVE